MTASTTALGALDKAERQAERLRERLTKADAQIDALRDDLGRAMATGASEPKLDGIRKRLRAAEDEREAAERGLAFLSTETDRLRDEHRSAEIEDAVSNSDAKVSEAVAAVDTLAETLTGWLTETFLPLADAAEQRSADAFEAERHAARLTGDSSDESRTRNAWSRYPGLAATVRAVRRYAGS
jgi:chromosome segregation ATPase